MRSGRETSRAGARKGDERRSRMAMKKVIERGDILRVVERLLEVSIERNEPFAEPIVMVGGTAMIAHDLRKQSYDVDLFVKDFSIDAVASVELEFKEIFGESFRIDVTSVENIPPVRLGFSC